MGEHLRLDDVGSELGATAVSRLELPDDGVLLELGVVLEEGKEFWCDVVGGEVRRLAGSETLRKEMLSVNLLDNAMSTRRALTIPKPLTMAAKSWVSTHWEQTSWGIPYETASLKVFPPP